MFGMGEEVKTRHKNMSITNHLPHVLECTTGLVEFVHCTAWMVFEAE